MINIGSKLSAEKAPRKQKTTPICKIEKKDGTRVAKVVEEATGLAAPKPKIKNDSDDSLSDK